jgi:hypothetical protein
MLREGRGEGDLTPHHRGPVAQAKPGLEEHILGWLFLRPDLLSSLDADMIGQQGPPLEPDDFNSTENRALLMALQGAGSALEEVGPEDRLADLPEVLRNPGRAIVAEVQRKPPLTDERLLKDLGDSLLRLRLRHLSEQIRQLEALVRESQEADTEEWRQYKDTIGVYSAQKDHLEKVVHGRSTAGVLAQRKANVGANG